MVRKLSEAMSNNVDPAIVQACLAEYSDIDTQMKRLAQKQAAMFSRYEGQGVNRKSIKNTIKMSRQDRAAAAAQAKTDLRYYMIAGILKPADDEWVQSVSQSSIFEDTEDPHEIGKPSPDLARARAHADGYNSGRHGGEAINNPFHAGSQEFVAWEKGRTDGAADRKLRGTTSAKVKDADATPTRRGRPRKHKPEENGEAHAAA
jgi:hypothetical protein